jgi:hypothetical protein
MLLAGETPCSSAATKAGMMCSVLPLEEQKTQMAIWSMMSAPLLLSADLSSTVLSFFGWSSEGGN